MIALAPGLVYGRRTSTGVRAADGATSHDRQFILNASHKPGAWMAPLPAATNSRRAFMLIRACVSMRSPLPAKLTLVEGRTITARDKVTFGGAAGTESGLDRSGAAPYKNMSEIGL